MHKFEMGYSSPLNLNEKTTKLKFLRDHDNKTTIAVVVNVRTALKK